MHWIGKPCCAVYAQASVSPWVYIPPPLHHRALGWNPDWQKPWQGGGMLGSNQAVFNSPSLHPSLAPMLGHLTCVMYHSTAHVSRPPAK